MFTFAKHQHGHHRQHHRRFWFLWPFKALWMLVSTILEMTGRLVGMVVGLVFIIVGFLISLTIVGAIVGIPLAIVGFLLLLRGIF